MGLAAAPTRARDTNPSLRLMRLAAQRIESMPRGRDMKPRVRRRSAYRLISLGMAGLLLAWFVGCSAGSGAGSAPANTTVTTDESADRLGGGPVPADGKTPTAGERMIARSASVSVTVTDVMVAAGELARLAASLGGSVTSESLGLDTERAQVSYVVLSVPAARLDEALSSLAGLGEITSRVIESSDVTDAVVDVDARIKTLRESIARLQALMKRAGSVADIAAVESQLTTRQADLESLLAQQKALSTMVEKSLITVSLTPRDTATPAAQRGFLAGLAAGWDALLATGQILLTVAGAILPFLGAALIVAAPLGYWLRRHRRAARAAARASAASEPGASESDASESGASESGARESAASEPAASESAGNESGQPSGQ